MTIASLATILNQARQNSQAIAGLVVLGWEDITAFIAAAEAENMPVILQAGPGCRAHTPLPVLGAMLCSRESICPNCMPSRPWI